MRRLVTDRVAFDPGRVETFFVSQKLIGEYVQHRRRAELRICLGDIVEIGDVGSVMLVVVDFHGSGIDMRLKRIEQIAEGRNHEWTCRRGRSRR